LPNCVATKQSGDFVYPVVWPADRPGTVEQVAGTGRWGTFDGIDDDGTIVGLPDGVIAVWTTVGDTYGPARALPTLPSMPNSTSRAIRGGWVVGQLISPLNGDQVDDYPAIWRVGAGGQTLVSQDPDVEMADVDSEGTAVGNMTASGKGRAGPAYGVIYRDGKLRQLPLSGPAASDSASAVSDGGHLVVGTAVHEDAYADTIVTWHC
jgi:hypothetical protein